MDEAEIKKRLDELLGIVNPKAVPEVIVTPITPAQRARGHEVANELSDRFELLRLTIKYHMFDLDATRRENGYLRRMLEETNGQ